MGNYCCCCVASVDNQRSPNIIKPPSPGPGTTLRLYQNKGKEVVSDPTITTTPRPSSTITTMKIPYLKIYTFAELKSATRNFRPDTVLGEGGFGTVFKGWIDQQTYAPSRVGIGIPVAVKKANSDTSQDLKQWQAEVNFLGKFTHPNLVKLLGFCSEEREFLLVYEYMQKGSFETHLFKKGSAEPLPWEVRLNIAIGAARGLAFLHNSEKKVIYRDFKTSNILLDGSFNAKLSDFGLARLGPSDGNSHLTTDVLGTYGYAAPEYLATGHLYVKSDVYSFGVVLLEMLTGQRALDLNRPTGQHYLVEWAKPSLDDKRNLTKIMDPNIERNYPLEGAYQAAQLVLTCLASVPKNRPSMDQVLESLEKVNNIKFKRKETKNNPLPPNQQQKSPLHHLYQQNHHRSPIHANHVNKRAADGQAEQHPSRVGRHHYNLY